MGIKNRSEKENAMTPITGTSDSAARRAAKQIACRAVKSRWRKDSIDNHGGLRIIDNYTNTVVAGGGSIGRLRK
jgi:hypothetical protein